MRFNKGKNVVKLIETPNKSPKKKIAVKLDYVNYICIEYLCDTLGPCSKGATLKDTLSDYSTIVIIGGLYRNSIKFIPSSSAARASALDIA